MAVGWFYLSFYALSLLGLMCIILTVYWMQLWHGGFAWDGTSLMFNYHPVFMVAGSVVVYSAGTTTPSHTPVCPVKLSLPTAPGCWSWSLGYWCSISSWFRLGNAQSQGS
uniref:Cytochrome b561 family member A3 n=1 Tax=Panthera tigris altaica TaxID=74533 RepID=A0A8C9MDJ9_PANTA